MNSTNLYTDGSVINNNAGAGVSCTNPYIELTIPLGTNCSIYLAEVSAIIKCCQEIEKLDITNQVVSIYTDSQSALKALRSPKISTALTLKCWESLDTI